MKCYKKIIINAISLGIPFYQVSNKKSLMLPPKHNEYVHLIFLPICIILLGSEYVNTLSAHCCVILYRVISVTNVCVVQVLDLIAELDCLMAMSSASQEYGYTSPKLSSHKRITVTQGR